MAEPTWFDKGFDHFFACLRAPEKAKADYPTQDKHTPKEEADFIRGFTSARAQHAASITSEDYGEGQPWLEGY